MATQVVLSHPFLVQIQVAEHAVVGDGHADVEPPSNDHDPAGGRGLSDTQEGESPREVRFLGGRPGAQNARIGSCPAWTRTPSRKRLRADTPSGVRFSQLPPASPCSSDGQSIRLLSGEPLVRVQPGARTKSHAGMEKGYLARLITWNKSGSTPDPATTLTAARRLGLVTSIRWGSYWQLRVTVNHVPCWFDSSRRSQPCPRSSVERASGYEPEGRRFDSCRGYERVAGRARRRESVFVSSRHIGGVAQRQSGCPASSWPGVRVPSLPR